jgi:hypothetical protein
MLTKVGHYFPLQYKYFRNTFNDNFTYLIGLTLHLLQIQIHLCKAGHTTDTTDTTDTADTTDTTLHKEIICISFISLSVHVEKYLYKSLKC